MDGPQEWTRAEAATLLLAPTARDDKYSRGVVGVVTGSGGYPGAAVLGVEAAWRAGAGMVRYLGPDSVGALVLARRPETLCAPGRVQSWVIGSGTDAATRGDGETQRLREILAGEVPVVVDAGALALGARGAAPRILTPHEGEHARLREVLGLAPADPRDGDRVTAAVQTARETGAVVVLKGAVTVVAAPDGTARTVTTGVAQLATAGSGDVLAGILGAVLAQSRGPVTISGLVQAGATAAWVHGRAGAAAVQRAGGGPVLALDVARAVAPVIGDLWGLRAPATD